MSKRQFIPLGSFIRDVVIRRGFIWSVLLLAINLIITGAFYHRLPPLLPMFYSLVRGEQQLANKPFILILPLAAAAFFTTHLILAKVNFDTDRMFSRILAMSSALISFLFTVALAHIIIIVL